MIDMTQTLPKELQSTAVVRFQDCDPFQHLNNARYLDYFLNAREDQLANFYGFNIFEHTQTEKQAWVVTRTHIAYLAPAHVMESILIQTRLIHMSDTLIVVEGIMFDQHMKRAKAVVWMEFAYVSLVTGRPAKHADELMQLFAQVIANDASYEPDGFNSRAESIKRQYRKQPVEVVEQ